MKFKSILRHVISSGSDRSSDRVAPTACLCSTLCEKKTPLTRYGKIPLQRQAVDKLYHRACLHSLSITSCWHFRWNLTSNGQNRQSPTSWHVTMLCSALTTARLINSFWPCCGVGQLTRCTASIYIDQWGWYLRSGDIWNQYLINVYQSESI